MKSDDNWLLLLTLDVAVPLNIMRIQKEQPTPEQLAARGSEYSTIIGTRGDILQYGGGKAGQVAEAFNALADGLAILAFRPGGVTFAGRHWEAQL